MSSGFPPIGTGRYDQQQPRRRTFPQAPQTQSTGQNTGVQNHPRTSYCDLVEYDTALGKQIQRLRELKTQSETKRGITPYKYTLENDKTLSPQTRDSYQRQIKSLRSPSIEDFSQKIKALEGKRKELIPHF